MAKSVVAQISARGRIVGAEALFAVGHVTAGRGRHIATGCIAVTIARIIPVAIVARIIPVAVIAWGIVVTIPGLRSRDGTADDRAGRETRGGAAPTKSMATAPAPAPPAAAEASAPRHRLHGRAGGILQRRRRAERSRAG